MGTHRIASITRYEWDETRTPCLAQSRQTA